MKNIIFIIIGVFIGVVLSSIFNGFPSNYYDYIELQEDLNIENGGQLNKGTLLRVDESMPEGFTRYILYLNMKGGSIREKKTEKTREVIPYWLIQRGNMKN